MRDIRQEAVVQWVRATFGEQTLSIEERISRFLEEALELAQAERLPVERVRALVDHVYKKPPGEAFQEAGGVGLTLLAYCGAAGISAEAAEVAEFQRVRAIDSAYFRVRHNAKADAGIAVRADESE
jgi:hypothetical protein